MSDEQEKEATQLSVKIALACRNARRRVDEFPGQVVTWGELLALQTDAAKAWNERLDQLPLAAYSQCVVDLRRIKELIGEDGVVRDHGWENGREYISVAAIADHVAALGPLLTPFTLLRSSLKQRRAAA